MTLVIETIPEEVLKEESTLQLAEWASLLNNWVWPEGMSCKPENWSELPMFYRKDHYEEDFGKASKRIYIRPIHDYIVSKIGQKECSKYHHMYNLDKTEEVFEAWWEQRNRKD